MALLFQDWLEAHPGQFETVVFAVPGGPNYNAFADVFGASVPQEQSRASVAAAADTDDDDEIIEGQCSMLEKRLAPEPMRHIPIASCFRDAEPRTTDAWNALGFKFGKETKYHLSADGFRKVIRRMKTIADALPDGAWGKRIFMIDNWNEWDEGHYIAPSHEYGFRYLQAIREELTLRDNLPDYRTPQDLGLAGYNTSWEIPDFTAICKEKLGL